MTALFLSSLLPFSNNNGSMAKCLSKVRFSDTSLEHRDHQQINVFRMTSSTRHHFTCASSWKTARQQSIIYVWKLFEARHILSGYNNLNRSQQQSQVHPVIVKIIHDIKSHPFMMIVLDTATLNDLMKLSWSMAKNKTTFNVKVRYNKPINQVNMALIAEFNI